MTKVAKKIITASAGTGKTFQLSVEFISLLFQGIAFEKILVVTFTRKATAEIRQRIFEQLDLVRQYKSGNSSKEADVFVSILKTNLPSPDLFEQFNLEEVWRDLKLNKNKLNIFTIDGYIQKIFSQFITPYLGIYGFELIDEATNQEFYEQILNYCLENQEAWKQFKHFLKLSRNKKNILGYTDIIKDLINARWLFELNSKNKRSIDSPLDLKVVRDSFDQIIHKINQEGANLNKVLKADFKWISEYATGLDEAIFKKDIKLYYSKLLKVNNFWNSRLLKAIHADLLMQFESFKRVLAIYCFSARIIATEDAVWNLAKIVFQEYDRLKFGKYQFTYQDILYYSYKYLYDPNLSLIDPARNVVENLFYELLSIKTSHVLIDEFQDTSVLQWKMLLPLINEVTSDLSQAGGVVCVGDLKQAIYGWRGGEQGLLQALPEILDVNETLSLNVSYRGKPVLNKFFNKFFGSISKTIKLNRFFFWPFDEVLNKPGSVDGGYVRFSSYRITKQDKEEDIQERFVNEIANKISKNQIKLNGTAIITRKNSELDSLSELLAFKGIPFIKDTARSVFDHPAILELYSLLKYLAFSRFTDLLCFLRSEYICISEGTLKEILLSYRQNKYSNDISLYHNFPEIKSITELIEKLDFGMPVNYIVREIIKLLGAFQLYSSNHDVRNILRFTEIIDELVKNTSREYVDFIYLVNHIDKNRSSERYRQVGIESLDAIQLITIHKSKGLEFNNVFFYWDVSPRKMADTGLVFRGVYNEEYSELEEFVVYNSVDECILDVLPKYNELVARQKEKELIEEINAIYVAFTRVKQNLQIYCILRRQMKDIKKLRNFSASFSENMYFLLKEAMYSLGVEDLKDLEGQSIEFGSSQTSLSHNHHSCEGEDSQSYDSLDSGIREDDIMETSSKFLAQEYKFNKKDPKTEEKIKVAKTEYIKAQQRGNIVHEYLSYIRYNKPEEHEVAKNKVFYKYGGLIGFADANSLFLKIQQFMNENKAIYHDRWHVFNEHIVFHKDHEYRIDRLMIDPEKKEIRIIDYKTGEEKDPMQLQTYKKIVENLKNIKDKGYEISADFVEVDVD